MPIDNRTLTPGDKFVATYKKQLYRVGYHHTSGFPPARPFIGLFPETIRGQEYRTLSDAGKAIMGGIACNGWRFFSRDDGSAPSAPAAPTAPKAPRSPRPTPIGRAKKGTGPTTDCDETCGANCGHKGYPAEVAGKPVSMAKARAARARSRVVKQIKRIGNQGGAPEGTTRWWCSACMEGFNAEGTARPATCPQGHPAEVEDDLAPEVAIPAGVDD